jgi:hypothetical protein
MDFHTRRFNAHKKRFACGEAQGGSR